MNWEERIMKSKTSLFNKNDIPEGYHKILAVMGTSACSRSSGTHCTDDV